jgi:hypothetical protein
VEAGSAQPRSLAAKQAFITEIGKLGWISPEKALRYMDMAETGKMYEESQIDARQVQRENAKMSSTGQTLPINEWDNDQEHEANHANYMKTQEFEKLDPQVQQALVEHLQLHRSRMQTNMQQAQMAQGQMPPQAPQEMGAPPG